MKSVVSGLFDRLKGDLRDLAEADPGFSEMSTTISNVAVDVQRSLDAAAAWFVKPEGQQASHKFTLKQSVEIAVQSALVALSNQRLT